LAILLLYFAGLISVSSYFTIMMDAVGFHLETDISTRLYGVTSQKTVDEYSTCGGDIQVKLFT
jgi:hypothetical protein